MRVSRRSASTDSELRPVDGALLRLPVGDDGWAEGIPPVPRGFEVTVSFSSPDLAAQHADAVELLGYRVVGVAPADVPSAMLLVPQQLAEARDRYWRSLRSRADAAYSLVLGPALSLLQDTVRLHLTPPTTPPPGPPTPPASAWSAALG